MRAFIRQMALISTAVACTNIFLVVSWLIIHWTGYASPASGRRICWVWLVAHSILWAVLTAMSKVRFRIENYFCCTRWSRNLITKASRNARFRNVPSCNLSQNVVDRPKTFSYPRLVSAYADKTWRPRRFPLSRARNVVEDVYTADRTE
jgi:hypothetical protein